MKLAKKFAFALTVCSLVAGGQVQGAEHYMVDGSHTSVVFGVSHMGYSYTYGRFNKLSGAYVLDRANPAASQFQLTIDAASIDSNDQKRDEHLKGPDFFNVKQFPVISFQSTRVTPQQTDNKTIYQVTGNLTIHGVTRPVTLPVQKLDEGNGPAGNYRTGFLCQTNLKRSEFGMTNMIPMIGDEVAITVSFEGLRQSAPAGSSSAPKEGSGTASAPAAQPAGSGSAEKQQGGGSGAR